MISETETFSDASSTSVESNFDASDNYEQEIEEFASLSVAADESGNKHGDDYGAVLPYVDEPIADEEWVKIYEKEQERENTLNEVFKERLDGRDPISHW